MHPSRRIAAALASVLALLLCQAAVPSAATAATGPYLDMIAFEDRDITTIEVGNAGDAPLTACAVTVINSWDVRVATVATRRSFAPGEYRRFHVRALPRGYYMALGECAEDRYGVAFTTRTPEFVDVPPTAQFHSQIMWMASEGISTGWPDGTFRPLESINRDAMAVFLYRMAGEPAVTPPAVSPFSDVPTHSPFYTEIYWLASTGITRGYADGTYRPLQPVTRDAMAAFLFRFFYDYLFPGRFVTYPEPTTPPFADVAGSPFVREMAWMKEYGITTGYPDGTYRPLQPVTREAMAAFLFREHLLRLANTAEAGARSLPIVPADVAHGMLADADARRATRR
ncbi:MAG: S-layer homology domain-containing protein [Propionibacteriaceae bacterium]|nr:S-layer homology domain-containing protein [Propionibacteriaceae bacterium]